MAVRGIKWPGLANLVVSLVAIHKGQWNGLRLLDGKKVAAISSFFEDSEDIGESKPLSENADMIFEGVKFLGEGFLLTHEEAKTFIDVNPQNKEVIFKLINGDDLNGQPDQSPSRSIIHFHDWSLDRAQQFKEPFDRVLCQVKPIREKDNRALYRDKWWLYAEARRKLTSRLPTIQRCFASSATTKYLNFSALPTDFVFSQALKIFTTDRWDLYAVVQSILCTVKFSVFICLEGLYSLVMAGSKTENLPA